MFNGGQSQIMEELLRAIAAEYQWPAFRMRELEPIALDPVELDRYVGKFAGAGESVEVSREGSKLFVTSSSGRKAEAVLVAPDKLVIVETAVEGTVTFGANGRAAALRMYGGVLERQQ